MEQTLDLPVKSEPLLHLTKTRIRNNSRKVSIPSKNLLKRNVNGEVLQSQRNMTEKSIDMDASLNKKDLRLKLPPPPVPKKPKINLSQSLSKMSPDGKSTVSQNSKEENQPARKPKPAVAPKPNFNKETKSTSDKHAEKEHSLEKLDLRTNNNERPINETQEKDLNSPRKSSMSFSERLKASSLSRRKDANISDGFTGNFKSQMISPIRRGSRNFLNSDSLIESDVKMKPKEPIFKRFSSETSLKLEESDEKKYNCEDFDLEQLKNLSLAPVEPVIVDSALSPSNSFDDKYDDDTLIKDSFDSGELFNTGNEMHQLKSDICEKESETARQANSRERAPIQKDVDNIAKSGAFKLPSDQSINSKVIARDESLVSISSGIGTGRHYFEREEDLHGSKIHYQKEFISSFDKKLSINPNADSASFEPESHKNDDMDGCDNRAMEEDGFARGLESPVKFGIKSKEGKSFQRKFKPIGMSEVKSSTVNKLSKEESNRSNVTFTDVTLDLNGTHETDSSLEHVTQEIELDSTFDIVPSFNAPVLSNDGSKIDQEGGTYFDNDKGIFFESDLSSSPPQSLFTRDCDKFSVINSSLFLPSFNGEKFPPNSPFKVMDEKPTFSEEETSNFFATDFSPEPMLSVDVDMLPFVPPPLIEEDAFDSDEDMTLNIIDPPTVYEDEDMDMVVNGDPKMTSTVFEETTMIVNHDIITANDLCQIEDVMSKKEGIIEEAFLETEIESKYGYDETDFDDLSPNFKGNDDRINAEPQVPPSCDVSQLNVTSNRDNCDDDGGGGGGGGDDDDDDDDMVRSAMSKSSVLSIARQWDMITNDDDSKKSIKQRPFIRDTKPIINEQDEFEGSKVLVHEAAYSQPQFHSKEAVHINGLNGHENLLKNNISDKGKERRKSFSDRSAANENCESKDNDIDYRIRSNDDDSADSVQRRRSDDGSPFLMRPNLKQADPERTGQEATMSADVFDSDVKSLTSLNRQSGTGQQEIIDSDSYLNVHKGSAGSNASDQETKTPAYSSHELLPAFSKSISRKSSRESLDSSAQNEKMRKERSRKRWSSFCSTSSDDQANENKVNIARLMRERTITLSNDHDQINHADYDDKNSADHSSDEEKEESNVADFDEVFPQNDYDSRFDSIPLDEWTIEDVGDWLEMIGLPGVQPIFKEKNIDGQQLQDIDLKLLDDIGIANIMDRELILSEIYSLKNPEDFDIELSLLDALDNASGYDREKMLAVLEALKMSSEDQENHYLPNSPPPKLSTGMRKKSSKTKKKKGSYRRTLSEFRASSDNNNLEKERSQSASPIKRTDENRIGHYLVSPKTGQKEEKAKKSSFKKTSFLKEAFSFRRRSGRLSRLFGSRKKLVDSSLKYLLQSAPQGIVKIWTIAIKGLETTDVSLLVTSTTTSLEVTKSVIEKLALAVDCSCYYLVESHSSKSVPEVVLKDSDCPLVRQCRWPDAERYKFELREHHEGSIIIVFSEDANDERSVKIETMMKTTCAEIISIALKKLQKPEPAICFALYHIKFGKKQEKSNAEEEAQMPMDASLLTMTPSTPKPVVYKLVRVNFLGSPEKSFKTGDEKRQIKQLQDEVREKEKQLLESNESLSSIEKQLKAVTGSNEYLKQKLNDKNEDVARLENIADSLRIEMDQKNGPKVSKIVDNMNENQVLAKKLSMEEEKTKSLKEWIDNLEKTLQQKEGNLKRLESAQVKIGIFKNKEMDEKSTKLKEIEEENKNLKSRIVQIENQSLENRITSSELEAQLVAENMILQGEMNELRNENVKLQAEEERRAYFQEEHKNLEEELERLRLELTKMERKQLEWSEKSRVTEGLKDRIVSLERLIKQKDRMVADSSILQRDVNDLRAQLGISDEENAAKARQIEELNAERIRMVESFANDMKSKDHEIEEMQLEIKEKQKDKNEANEEIKNIKLRMKELEKGSHEKDEKMEELNEIHEELKDLNQRKMQVESELRHQSNELQKLRQEKDVALEELRNHIETMEQKLMDKESKILDLEFELQKAERSLREAEELVDDENREKTRLGTAVEDGLQKLKKLKEFSKKVEDYKRLVAEKDKIIQNLKGNQSNADESLKREISNSKRMLIEKEQALEQVRVTMDEERKQMKGRFETLQELVTVKEAKWKEKEARLMEERKSDRIKHDHLEKKLSEKETNIRKLEAKVEKLEKVARDNMRKFEKFMSNKDRILRQVKDESEREINDLKSKIHRIDDDLTEKEKHMRQLNRSESITQEFETKLKQKEEENKQHKFLLEKLMAVVNSKDPGILEEFENSFGQAPKISRDDKRPLISKVDDEWC